MVEGRLEKFELPSDLAELDPLAKEKLRKLRARDILDPEWACGTGKHTFDLFDPRIKNRLQAEKRWVSTRRGTNLRNRVIPRNPGKLR